MRRLAVLVLLLAPACKGGGGSSPSCHDRVAVMAAHLAAPRSLAAIRADAAPSLIAALDHVATLSQDQRAMAYAQAAATATQDCPTARDALGGVASIGGGKADYLRDKIPPAVEACQCQAAPEQLGGLLEALETDGWAKSP